MLHQLALFVQTAVQKPPGLDLAGLLSSGFDAVSTNRAQHPLLAPTILGIDNPGSGQLSLRLKAAPNARMYAVRYQTLPNPALPGAQTTPGPWVNAGLFGSTRGLIVAGLTPGQKYGFQVRAMGGSTGQSDWSDAVSHMSCESARGQRGILAPSRRGNDSTWRAEVAPESCFLSGHALTS